MPDWSERREPARPPLAAAYALARPQERLGAVVIDVCVILVPVFVLLSAPLKRALSAGFLLGAESEIFLNLVLMFTLGVSVLALYQAVCHHVFGATVGKRAFGLRVTPVFPGQPVAFGTHVYRALAWIAGVLGLGLPFLGVFSNPQRRPFHDRVSDTLVVTTRMGQGAQPPGPFERASVRFGVGLAVALLVAVVGVELRETLDHLRLENTLLVGEDTPECEVVAANAPEDEEFDVYARLKTALSLYAAGLADRSCLAAEVERADVAHLPVTATTYLALSFVHADDAEISNAYLDKVCAERENTPECAMSRLVTGWSDEDWTAVGETLERKPKGSGYLEVWGVRHYMKQADYTRALGELDQLVGRPELSSFSLRERVRALYNAYHAPEAREALKQALVTLPEDEGRDLSAWACTEELARGCGAIESFACQPFAHVEEPQVTTPAATLATVAAVECTGEADYIRIGESTEDENWRTFFRANLKRQRQDRTAAVELFTDLVESETAPDVLRVEAARRLAKLASPKQLEGVIHAWSEFESREAWVKVGNIVLARMLELGHADLALGLARDLMTRNSLSPDVASHLARFGAPAQRAPASREGK